MIKAILLFFTSIFLLLFIFLFCRFYVFAPAQYWIPAPGCIQERTFDISIAGTGHLSEIKTFLKTKKPDQYRYFFKTFLEEEKTYMVLNFRNKKECFDVKMLVEKWDILTGMRLANGKSYPEELYDLKWEVTEMYGVEEVVYLDMHWIVD